jgi:4'-phosphopantetheinyl transferase EntD
MNKVETAGTRFGPRVPAFLPVPTLFLACFNCRAADQQSSTHEQRLINTSARSLARHALGMIQSIEVPATPGPVCLPHWPTGPLLGRGGL